MPTGTCLPVSTARPNRKFLWGSYVTGKALPNDLDALLVVADDFSVESTPVLSRPVFEHAQAGILLHADVFWTKAGIGESMLNVLLETYQVGKDFKRRGIVEVVL